MKTESTTRGAKAIRALNEAARCTAAQSITTGWSETALNRIQEKKARAEAEELLKPNGKLVSGCGEIAHVPPGDCVDSNLLRLVDTLASPTMLNIGASGQRMEAAQEAGVLQAAVDAAESARAGNSLEKMLCHQMAAAHHAAMKLLTRGMTGDLEPVETVRLTNAAARMMQVYQEGLLTLQKIRTGGKQTVTVQHVQVSGGGQAVITGSVKASDGGLARERVGRADKMKRTPHGRRRGWLRNGNPPEDLSKVMRCGAKTRRGTGCQCPAMANGRCRMHGGLSTGPKTAEGLARIRRAVTKHGWYSSAARLERQGARQALWETAELVRQIREECKQDRAARRAELRCAESPF